MRVKIKTWEKMVEEFGVNENGDINIHLSFTREMENLMPVHRIIYVEKIRENVYEWYSRCLRPYGISNKMIESYLGEEVDVFTSPLGALGTMPIFKLKPIKQKKPRIKKRSYNINY